MAYNPHDVAKWLQIALAQRKRLETKFAQDFGPSSPATMAITNEVAAITEAVNDFVKEAAKAPMRK